MTTLSAPADLDALLAKCLHCGLCLPVCPTYEVTGREESSPRGRIRLLRELERGTLGLTDPVIDEINFCLDCQACEAICPAGVRYGALVEDARARIAESGREARSLRLLRKIILRWFLAGNNVRKIAVACMMLYNRSGLRDAVDRSGVLDLFPERVSRFHRLMPRVGILSFLDRQTGPAVPTGTARGRVALLTGCLMDSAFADVHAATVAVLRRNGFEVVFPRGQVCCGSLHAHYGDREKAHALARTNIGLFAEPDLDAVIVDSAGCAAYMKEYGEIFAADPEIARAASLVAGKTKEISEFLVGEGFEPPAGRLDLRVTYHDPCHLAHTQRITSQPRELLRSIPGLEFIELRDASWCCGSAGIYNLTRPGDADRFLDRKMSTVDETGADVVATANPGCHLQLSMGIEMSHGRMRVMHPVALLQAAYEAGDSEQKEKTS
ncbi:MAG TPA: (Fe-S)-binding protein [Bacteroidota bacterium]|nr:(Fe-S)-binding protein [Bacteroidota bacterium]